MNGYAKDTDRPELVAWRQRRMSEASARKPRNKAKYSRKGKTSWKGER